MDFNANLLPDLLKETIDFAANRYTDMVCSSILGRCGTDDDVGWIWKSQIASLSDKSNNTLFLLL